MSRYRKISAIMFSDRKYLDLSVDASYLWFHILCGPHNNIIPGLFCIGRDGIFEKQKLPKRKYLQAFLQICDANLLNFSNSDKIMFLKKSLKHNPPANPNVVKGWKNHWEEVPDCNFKYHIYQYLRHQIEGYGSKFIEAFDQAIPLPKPLVKPFGNPLPIQEAVSSKQEAVSSKALKEKEKEKERKTQTASSPTGKVHENLNLNPETSKPEQPNIKETKGNEIIHHTKTEPDGTQSDEGKDGLKDDCDYFKTAKGIKLKGPIHKGFIEFWKEFAHKKGPRQAADAYRQAFKKHCGSFAFDQGLHDLIIAGAICEVVRRDGMQEWQTPIMAQGWLTASRWEDEVIKQAPENGAKAKADTAQQKLEQTDVWQKAVARGDQLTAEIDAKWAAKEAAEEGKT